MSTSRMAKSTGYIESPKISIKERVRAGAISFVTGFLGGAITTIVLAPVVQRTHPLNRIVLQAAQRHGMYLGGIFLCWISNSVI